MPSGWDELKVEIQRIVAAGPESFDDDVVLQANELLAELHDRVRLPAVGRGYWPTIRFFWEGWEIEVFADRFELYDLRTGKIDVQYFEHQAGMPIPRALVAKLPAA